MSNNAMQIELTQYYTRRGIHPESFACPSQAFCRQYAHQHVMTETKMSMVGSEYGGQYRRIVVVSLDPPKTKNGECSSPVQRTTKYVSDQSEADDFKLVRPNPHWAMTQIIVKDILTMEGYTAQAGAAVVRESYAKRRLIENVSAYFAHVNVAKCSMNNPGNGQAAWRVHDRCSQHYLRDELELLRPDILITQGTGANKAVSALFPNRLQMSFQPPAAYCVPIGGKSALWLLMAHPARHTGAIRLAWPFYVQKLSTLHGGYLPIH